GAHRVAQHQADIHVQVWNADGWAIDPAALANQRLATLEDVRPERTRALDVKPPLTRKRQGVEAGLRLFRQELARETLREQVGREAELRRIVHCGTAEVDRPRLVVVLHHLEDEEICPFQYLRLQRRTNRRARILEHR